MKVKQKNAKLGLMSLKICGALTGFVHHTTEFNYVLPLKMSHSMCHGPKKIYNRRFSHYIVNCGGVLFFILNFKLIVQNQTSV